MPRLNFAGGSFDMGIDDIFYNTDDVDQNMNFEKEENAENFLIGGNFDDDQDAVTYLVNNLH